MDHGSSERRQAVIEAIKYIQENLERLSLKIHANPELRFQEKNASAWLTAYLHESGFTTIENGVGGLETAFRASMSFNSWNNISDGPTIAILCEYDALPGVGHACGHNIIATSGAGAAIACATVARAMQRDQGPRWRLQCIGTPAEEGGGGKVLMIKAGVFQDVDVAMMVHPFNEWSAYRPLLGIHRLACDFKGKASHASSEPWEGVNALDAVVQMYNSVSMMRQQIRTSARIHGIITRGGDAANIIPELASCEFYVRSEDLEYLDQLLERVKKCAHAAAMATGCTVEMRMSNPSYLPQKYNAALVAAFQENIQKLTGESCPITFDPTGSASSDIGNVSQVLPTIHPWVKITSGDSKPALHSREFAAAAASPKGMETMINCAAAMALTCLDVIYTEGLLDRIKSDFTSMSQSN